MKNINHILLAFLCPVLPVLPLAAQVDQPNAFGKESAILQQDRLEFRGSGDFFNPDWAPFYHGVASGDPLSDRVIIWTRVTPEELSETPIEVDWSVATDPDLEEIIASGTFTTGTDRDFTVKVDVTGLNSGTTYYYGFSALGKASLTGKTKTTPVGDQEKHLKFGVVSCSNYQAGFFNAYARLAERTDLDAIIHLGDYIYEYADKGYGNGSVWQDRPLDPAHEIVSLEDYRTRYSTYRLDTNLVRAHQQHPFITVWDDHESANDSFKEGAENHDPAEEGDWSERKRNAKQAYFEWMPIRDNALKQVYRTVQYGDQMELILLDTRLEGREQQIDNISNEALYHPDRTILGSTQKSWLLDRLLHSTARWKIIGQQVLFSQFHVGWAGPFAQVSYNEAESTFLDIWDGYPAERSQIVSFLEEQQIDNVVILTGDFHSSFGFDIADPPVEVTLRDTAGLGPQPFYSPSEYDPVTGAGSRAVEFATPSITSANFDENSTSLIAQVLQILINQEVRLAGGTIELGNPNPHMKYVDLVRHGYFILDVQAEKVQANWYYSPILEISTQESFGTAYYTRSGENHLQAATVPSPPKEIQDIPAPLAPPNAITPVQDPHAMKDWLVVSAFPNPATDFNQLHYVLNRTLDLKIALFSSDGKLIRNLLTEKLPAGIYTLQIAMGDLPSGSYFYRIEAGGQFRTFRCIKH